MHFQLAERFYDIGSWDEAIEQYEKALSLDPSLAAALNNMGLAHKRKRQYGRALDTFLRIIERWPENAAVASYNIACAYSLQNNADASLKWLQRAVDHGYTKWDRIKTDPDLDNKAKRIVRTRLTPSAVGERNADQATINIQGYSDIADRAHLEPMIKMCDVWIPQLGGTAMFAADTDTELCVRPDELGAEGRVLPGGQLFLHGSGHVNGNEWTAQR